MPAAASLLGAIELEVWEKATHVVHCDEDSIGQ
jgi:hypothetical protein